MSEFGKKFDLASLKFNVDKIDVDRLETVSTDLSKLSNLVKNDIVKNTTFDELVEIVDTIESNKENLAQKIEDVNKKIPNTSRFIVTKDFNRLFKITFDRRIAEASQNLPTKKSQVENALWLGYKNG